MKHSDTMEAAYTTSRSELLKYAAAITGDRTQAEDVLQDVWLRCALSASNANIRHPMRFLLRVVRNLSLDYRRRAMHQQRVLVDDGNALVESTNADYEASPEEAAIKSEEMRVLMQALSELDERTRVAVEMHRFDQVRLQDIADKLGISVTMAHKLVASGVAHCRRRICQRKPAQP